MTSCRHRVGGALLLLLLTGVAAADLSSLYQRVAPGTVALTATVVQRRPQANRVQHLQGAGFFVDWEGHILTNAHLVEGAVHVLATVASGERLPARLVGSDALMDLALLRVNAGAAAVPLPLGDSDTLRVGQEVLALGNPFGLGRTMTRGIVSAITPVFTPGPYPVAETLIQTDAAINPGNSGGPLLNAAGEVVGIAVSLIAEGNKTAFAIPVNVAKAVLPDLKAHGRVLRPWLGIQGRFPEPEVRGLLGLPREGGLLVEVVEEGSPAEQAGVRGGTLDVTVRGEEILLGGDLITAINDHPLAASEDFLRAVRPLKVGDTVRLRLLREGKPALLQYLLPARPQLPSDLAPAD